MKSTGKLFAMLGLAMALGNRNDVMSIRNTMKDVGVNPQLRSWRPGFGSFRGMKIGGGRKHFNKKRHGRMLRRKHKRSA